MDHRRVLVVAALITVAGLALAAQGGPVYTAVPPYPTVGGACKTGRVQLQGDTGAAWCCVDSVWTSCGGGSGATLDASATGTTAISIGTYYQFAENLPGTNWALSLFTSDDSPALWLGTQSYAKGFRLDATGGTPYIEFRNGGTKVGQLDALVNGDMRFDATNTFIFRAPLIVDSDYAQAIYFDAVGVQTNTFAGPIVAKNILGCADVRSFGAKGDGVTDDTAAIQAAVNSHPDPGGPVCLPNGRFKVTNSIALKPATSILGSSRGHFALTSEYGTVLDASSTTDKVILNGGTNSRGVTIRDLTIIGPGVASATGWSSGIYPAYFGYNTHIENVNVFGFRYGIILDYQTGATLLNVHSDGHAVAALQMVGVSESAVIGGRYSNSGLWDTDGDTGNIIIKGNSWGIVLNLGILDEGGGSSLLILDASSIHVNIPLIFLSKGGCGIRLGNGTLNPRDVVINGTRVAPFDPANRNAVHAIRLYGERHTLIGVRYNGGMTGGGLQDNSTRTTYFDVDELTTSGAVVNHISFLDPSMPTTAASGSKRLWYDAADANRVKFAP